MPALAAAITPLRRLLGLAVSAPAALTGPIFAKELRVSSRRRRNFVLRTVYLAALTLFVLLVWWAAMQETYYRGHNSHAYRISRMAKAGEIVIACIAWFQFCAVLLVTVIMLSTSISEEVYHRTLGVLMTTPIRSFQIVVGKLLSKVLQLLLLLAMSLPVLAIARVLGGVPWSFVVASLCITVSTALLFAAVTMLFSILFRRAYITILVSLIALALLFGGIPLLVVLLVGALDLYRSQPLITALGEIFLNYNPFAAMFCCTMELVEPRAMRGIALVYWWVNCLASLGLAALVLALCVALVRRVALRQAAGATGAGPEPAAGTAGAAPAAVMGAASAGVAVAPGFLSPPTLAPVQEGAAAAGPAPAPPPIIVPPAPAPRADTRPIRAVYGSPIVWRELHAGWMRHRVLFWVFVGVAAWLLLIVYALVAMIDDGFADDDTHAVFMAVYSVLCTVVTVILAGTNVTSEKEADTWDILLCTPLSSWHIVLGKAAGAARRCLPIWGLPFGHALLFAVIGWIHPALLVHLSLVTVSVVGLLTGSGLYFGARFKRTTTAVIMNLALAVTLWAAGPGVLALAAEGMRGGGLRQELRNLTEYAIDANPVYQATLATERLAGRGRADGGLGAVQYYWEGASSMNFADSTAYLALFAGGYVGAGAVFAWRARCRIRRARS